MRKLKIIAVIKESIVALFVLLFLYTAISKLSDYNTFASAMAHSPVIGRFASELAWMVPSAEISVAILLYFPSTRYAGVVLSTVLMTIFTGYLLWIILFSSVLPCTCGGIIQQLSWKQHLALNTILLLLSIVAIFIYKWQNNFIAISRKSRIPV